MTSGPSSATNRSKAVAAVSDAAALARGSGEGDWSDMSNGHPVALLEVLLALDLFLDLEQPLQKSLGPRRATGHVDVDRNDLVDAFANRVGVLKEPAAVRAAAHRNDVARLGHLVVQSLDPQSHFVGQ